MAFRLRWLLVFNALVFVIYGLWSRHFARDLALSQRPGPSPRKSPIMRLRFHGEKARRYNALQKLAYCFVIFVLGPLIVLTGLTRRPPWTGLPVLPGCSADARRRAQFISSAPFPFGFFPVHIAMVMLSGTWNNLRSMITGWYVIRGQGAEHD